MDSKLFMDRGRPCVYLPQLDKPQSEYRYQRKMFAYHKNMHSVGFLIGTDSVTQRYRDAVLAAYRGKGSASPPASRHSISESRDISAATEVNRLKQQLREKQSELETIKAQHRRSAKDIYELNRPLERTRLRVHHNEPSFIGNEFKVPRPKNDNSLVFNLAAQRLFAFPRYTHSHPKPAGLNPITGLRSQSVLRTRSEAC